MQLMQIGGAYFFIYEFGKGSSHCMKPTVIIRIIASILESIWISVNFVNFSNMLNDAHRIAIEFDC